MLRGRGRAASLVARAWAGAGGGWLGPGQAGAGCFQEYYNALQHCSASSAHSRRLQHYYYHTLSSFCFPGAPLCWECPIVKANRQGFEKMLPCCAPGRGCDKRRPLPEAPGRGGVTKRVWRRRWMSELTSTQDPRCRGPRGSTVQLWGGGGFKEHLDGAASVGLGVHVSMALYDCCAKLALAFGRGCNRWSRHVACRCRRRGLRSTATLCAELAGCSGTRFWRWLGRGSAPT